MAIRARSDSLSLQHASEAAAPSTPIADFNEMWSHREAVRQTCRRIVGDPSTVDDLVQDTYVKALRANARLEPRESTAPWLATVARHRSIDELRRRDRGATFPMPLDLSSDTSDDPAQRVVNQELAERLRAALAELTPRERTLLLRRVSHGMSVAQLAVEEATSIASVRSVLVRARHKLRMSIEKSGVLATLPVLRSLRGRLQRWAGRLEGALPMLIGGAMQLSQLVAALLSVVVMLLGGSLPTTSATTIEVMGPAATAGGDTEAPAAAPTGQPGPSGDEAEGDADPPPPDPGVMALPPGVDLPALPDEGVDQPDFSRIHSLAASPDGVVVFAAGTSGTTGRHTLYRSTDGGYSWEKLGDNSVENVQRNRSFLGKTVLVSPAYKTDKRVFALSDKGLQRSDDGGHLFTPASPTRGEAAVLSPGFASGDERVFVAGPPALVYDSATRTTTPLAVPPPSAMAGGIAIGPDFAATGEVLLGGVQIDAKRTPAVFTCVASGCSVRASLPGLSRAPHVLVSATSPHVVFAWTDDHLYRSRDGGHTFAPLSLPDGFALEHVTQGNGGLFLLGQATGASASGVLVSHNEGAGWEVLGRGTALQQRAMALVALPGNRVIAAPYDGLGLLCSHDGGATWADRCPKRRGSRV